MNSKLSENLKKIRKENNLSQEQLAEKMGVSRQAISKWESDQAYPEMEKIIQLCNMFDLNIDDLLNNDIGEVKREEESKLNINRYIDDFLNFVSDTVNLFCSLTFKWKIRCFFEQCVIAFVLFCLGALGGTLFDYCLRGILGGILPHFITRRIYSVFGSLYVAAAVVVGVIIIIHIFKIRYLNYYKNKEDITEGDNHERTESDDSNAQCEKDGIKLKKFRERAEKRIIIRDEKDGSYSFLNAMLKCVVWTFKAFLLMAAVALACMMICFAGGAALSFAVIKTGLFFAGLLLAMLSLTFGTGVMLLAVLNFVFNRKNSKKVMIWSFLVALVALGIGGGTAAVGLLQFDVVNYKEYAGYVQESQVFEMYDDLFINQYYTPIVFVEEDREDLKIEYYRNKNFEVEFGYDGVALSQITDVNDFEIFKEALKLFNEKKLWEDGELITDIKVYASEENIEKLKSNWWGS